MLFQTIFAFPKTIGDVLTVGARNVISSRVSVAASSPSLPPPSAGTLPPAPDVSAPPGTTALDLLFPAYLDAWLVQAFDRLLADLQQASR
jgi:hypothetical protein